MNIEIANRLVKLRKKNGLSQEELADKLGLSRQAVSKWERAEASPDTDNLICLAKLYNVSLDDLLNTDEDLDTIVKEQVKENQQELVDDKDKIVIADDEGSEVKISSSGIHIKDSNGEKCINKETIIEHAKSHKAIWAINIVESILFGVVLTAYLVLGFIFGTWSQAWVLVFVPETICSIIRAIVKKKFSQFNIVFAALFTYFFVCLWIPGPAANLWHPTWIVFLSIPAYYIIFGSIDKLIRGPSVNNDDDEDEDDKD